MDEVIIIFSLITLCVAAYVSGWINCKIRMYKVLRHACDKLKSFEDKQFNKGWLECLIFILRKLKF